MRAKRQDERTHAVTIASFVDNVTTLCILLFLIVFTLIVVPLVLFYVHVHVLVVLVPIPGFVTVTGLVLDVSILVVVSTAP